jgi:hypothetical protein
LVDDDKKKFWLMINITMELTNHPPLTKEAIIVWYNALSKYEFDDVKNAIDKWVDYSSKPPTPHDILKLCRPEITIYAKIPSPLQTADNHRHAVEVKEAVQSMTKPKRDMKGWARRIISGEVKSNYHRAIEFAKEALGNAE